MGCLFKTKEIINGKPIVEPVIVEGIINKFGLHPDRVKEAKEEVEGFIEQLPETFKEGGSFLNVCTTKDGELWTGQHMVAEQLVVLGIAIGKIEYCAPREMWTVLPGEMPYIRVL
jgi:hypothetical protein